MGALAGTELSQFSSQLVRSCIKLRIGQRLCFICHGYQIRMMQRLILDLLVNKAFFCGILVRGIVPPQEQALFFRGCKERQFANACLRIFCDRPE